MSLFYILGLIVQFCVAPEFFFDQAILSLTQLIHTQKIKLKWKLSPPHRNRSLTSVCENTPFIIYCVKKHQKIKFSVILGKMKKKKYICRKEVNS